MSAPNPARFRLPANWPAEWQERFTLVARGMGAPDDSGYLQLEAMPFVKGEPGCLLWDAPKLGFLDAAENGRTAWAVGEWCSVALMVLLASYVADDESQDDLASNLAEMAGVDVSMILAAAFDSGPDVGRNDIAAGFVAGLGYYLGSLAAGARSSRDAFKAMTPERWNEGLQRILDGESVALPGLPFAAHRG